MRATAVAVLLAAGVLAAPTGARAQCGKPDLVDMVPPDGATGVPLNAELAAHYARPENQPAYSVVFLLFGAEEAGLVGSRYFVAHPLVPLPRIKFLVNLDLLGTGEDGVEK